MSTRAVYLGDRFAMADEPGGAPSGIAVLLVGPFGWDAVASHRARRAWATQLAAAGHLAVRLDLPGAGDSAGAPGDPGLADAWIAAVTESVAALHAGGAARVAVVGTGLGGFVAAQALAAGASIDELVLWAVPSTGRRLVRELEAFARLQESELGAARALEPIPEGGFEAGGYVLAAPVVAALQEADLAGDWPDLAGRRALLLGRDGTRPDKRLVAALDGAGAEVQEAPGDGYGRMHSVPHESEPAAAVFGDVARWLTAAPAATPTATALPGADRLELDVDGATVTERGVWFDAPGARLFGILTEPPADAEPAGVVLVLLNAGAIPRPGPNRMWTEAARRSAAAGVVTLRLDVEGIGDAGGPDARDADVTLYDDRFVAQVRAALDGLEEGGLPPRFVLGGLCAGSFWAFWTALDDPRVATAIMLNPRLLVWDAKLVEVREARRVLGQAQGPAWRRFLRGDWTPARMVRLARAFVRSVVMAIRARSTTVDVSPVVGRMADGPARYVMAFSGDEPLLDELTASGELARLRELPNVWVEALPGSDHTLRPLAAQRAAHAVLDAALAIERSSRGRRDGPA